VGHLREGGFEVTESEAVSLPALADLRARSGVPPGVASCHTAFVDRYVIEGHVPADVLHDLLEQAPDIVGLAVAGMPPGSPGMESPSPVPYEILAIDADGTTSVFARR